MKKRSSLAMLAVFAFCMLFFPVQADAACSFVVKQGVTYCYNSNGTLYKGFLEQDSSKYYITSKGVLLKSKWIISGGKKYFASKTGKLYRNCIVKISGNYYGFDQNGVMQTGKSKVKGKTYYFYKKSGKMVRNAFVKIDEKKYYFAPNGVLKKNVWVKNYYVNSSGYVAVHTWVDKKYVGEDGHPLKGLQQIDGKFYFFDANGNKVTSTTKTIDKITYTFDKNGVGTTKDKVNETTKPSCTVEGTYYTDPKVSEEELLAAIIYCESGNQPYYGQLAVGIVITNRMRSSKFPNKLKEVIYQKVQFSPSFDGNLTRALKNPGIVTESAKKAAKEVMNMYRSGSYKVTANGKTINLKNYLFFMTKPAYVRLKLSSPYKQLGAHVFFKAWKY